MAIVVFDIGKTNKKLLVYDPDLRLVDSTFAAFPEIAAGDGVLLEDTALISEAKRNATVTMQTDGALMRLNKQEITD